MSDPVQSAPATGPAPPAAAARWDPTEPLQQLLRDLRTGRHGLGAREAARRLTVYGPNVLPARGRERWWREAVRQLTHPLALLLWAAAALSLVARSVALCWAILAVIVVNATFAFAQERQAVRAVEALTRYLPPVGRVVRDGAVQEVDARELVPGDLLVVDEGEGICADARLLDGTVDVDLSTLTGESLPVTRTAAPRPGPGSRLQAQNLLFSGTTCVSGSARAVVVATGAHTELGRIAALSQRVRREESPLERQVRRVAWLIGIVALGVGIAFLPLGMVAGLSLRDAFIFAVGLLVANVPEGLLPTITLALAVGVRVLARRGALVKRLSAVETLGSTTVICTDKTGTLTQNRMQVVRLRTATADVALGGGPPPEGSDAAALVDAMAACTTADPEASGRGRGDATELALLQAARRLGRPLAPAQRDAQRAALFRFDPALKRMSVVRRTTRDTRLTCKGAPEELLGRCTSALVDGRVRALDGELRRRIEEATTTDASQGLRLLAVAERRLPTGAAGAPSVVDRDRLERKLTYLGSVGLLDPPRAEVRDAVARCHDAGLRVHVVTGDHGLTAAHVARDVGIGAVDGAVVAGEQLDHLPEPELDRLLDAPGELVFARSSPEAKLRIADALRHLGQVVAMTGDGVNDAPALRRADIGVAMGLSGTDVARQAATMVLTDDNFATIVVAIEAGRRVYDNVRKFITYIFAHAVPEVVPFVVFALSGGAVPLPLTVLQILAIDLGTETLPALALGREPAEPGLMQRPPRPRRESVIRPAMLVRAWGLMGVVSATLVMAGFFFVLLRAGWRPGDPTGAGTALHHDYVVATTTTFAGIVACQVGTAFACRTDRAALRQVGVTTNSWLLWGIGFELAFAAALIYVPPLQHVFGTAALPPEALGFIAPFPVLVWGVDELDRWRRRARRR